MRRGTQWGLDDHGDDWRESSACRDEDPELFWPIGSTGPALLQAQTAKAVCARCPVVARCLQYAIDNHEADGIWGATAPHERIPLWRDGPPSVAEVPEPRECVTCGAVFVTRVHNQQTCSEGCAWLRDRQRAADRREAARAAKVDA